MGGLVCRCFLQNPKLGADPRFAEARRLVDKFFTYATPHNGIDLRIVRNVPAWASFGDVNNFNRDRMAGYLGLQPSEDVSDLGGFPRARLQPCWHQPQRLHRDERTPRPGPPGDDSDGLVRTDNATTKGRDASGRPVASPRAYIHRSHSGHYGIVNSEEGYQNLHALLLWQLSDRWHPADRPVDPSKEVEEALDALPAGEKSRFKASYQFETAVSVRNCQWQMHRRTVRENSAIFRTYDDLFPRAPDGSRPPDYRQSPHLFSTFLNQALSVKRTKSVSLAFDVSVLVPDYTIDGVLFFKRHYEGGFIFRQKIVVEATPDEKQ